MSPSTQELPAAPATSWDIDLGPDPQRAALLQQILKNPRLPSPPTLALRVFQRGDTNVLL